MKAMETTAAFLDTYRYLGKSRKIGKRTPVPHIGRRYGDTKIGKVTVELR